MSQCGLKWVGKMKREKARCLRSGQYTEVPMYGELDMGCNFCEEVRRRSCNNSRASD